ncbi:hypothetical protein N7463_002771 [Penicillium fimorum]|uniref:Protein kinase domain-containing protein n=1 Tax=Penicillium fimorum TaxID=1882269 RepID=A0A9W9XZQ2_9EURO|nr:hypothetical protein N7463_002771 [Penicillium fimorum]
MPVLPDWVLDYKLETHFIPGSRHETVHTYYEQESLSQRRPIQKSVHWRREKKIGDGGFGEVWLERCTKGNGHGRGVRALKQIQVRQQINYNRELEAIVKFSHTKHERCFVKSFGWFQDEASLFIAMEYLELGDLQDYLYKKREPLSESEAQLIMLQTFEGLDIMHTSGFAHRDLKPNNILLKACPPDAWWVKIADFGISKRIEDGSGKSTTLKGTLGYIAPEIYGFTPRGSPYAVDIWAAGEILFQILTKRHTFDNLGLLSNYIKTPNNFPSHQLLATNVSQLGVEFVRCLMSPTPIGRISAKDALEHRWIEQALPHSPNFATPSYQETRTISVISVIDSISEEFASWDTIKDPCELKTITHKPVKEGESILQLSRKETEKVSPVNEKESSLRLSSKEIVRFPPVQRTESTSSRKGENQYRPKTDFGERFRVALTPIRHRWEARHFGRLVREYTLNDDSGGNCRVAFLPDNKLVAWKIPSNKETSPLPGNAVKIWDISTGELCNILQDHSDPVDCLEISPDGRMVASGSRDKTVKIWDFATGTMHCTLKGHSSMLDCLAFSPDSKLVVSLSAESARVWDTKTGEAQRTHHASGVGFKTLAFSPDGRTVAVGSMNGLITLWDAVMDMTRNLIEAPGVSAEKVIFSPDSTVLACSCNHSKEVMLWKVSTGAALHTLEGHSREINDLAFSSDSKSVASASSDHTVKLWDIATGALQLTMEGWYSVDSIKFSPDGKLLASIHRWGVEFWDVATGKAREMEYNHIFDCYSVAFSPDGSRVACASEHQKIKVWNCVT